MINLKSQKGLTLIEIMVALVIGLILVTAFTGALVIGLQTEGDMDERLEARNVIDSVIEELRSKDLTHVESEENLEQKIMDLSSFDNRLTIQEINQNDKNDDLYSFIISWDDKNYSTEALIATNIEKSSEDNNNENDNENENEIVDDVTCMPTKTIHGNRTIENNLYVDGSLHISSTANHDEIIIKGNVYAGTLDIVADNNQADIIIEGNVYVGGSLEMKIKKPNGNISIKGDLHYYDELDSNFHEYVEGSIDNNWNENIDWCD